MAELRFSIDFRQDRNLQVNSFLFPKALECTQKGERVPSLILETNEAVGHGKLFLGGFKACTNREFISKEQLKGVVNTVGNGLFGLFGRKFQVISGYFRFVLWRGGSLGKLKWLFKN